jgi:hypothetical protein
MEIDPKRSLSQDQFCWLENISRSKYFELKKRGLGPDVTDIDGVHRITPESREAWHERELAAIAGRAAAASPLHISKRQKPRPRRRKGAGAP